MELAASSWEDVDLHALQSEVDVDVGEGQSGVEQRSSAQRRGGILWWDYSSALEDLEIFLEDADSALGE